MKFFCGYCQRRRAFESWYGLINHLVKAHHFRRVYRDEGEFLERRGSG